MNTEKISNRRLSPIFLHILVWVIIFALPVFMYFESPAHGKFSLRVSVMLLGVIVTFYVNMLWAIDKLFFKRKYLWFIVVNIVLFCVVQETREHLYRIVDPPEPARHEPRNENSVFGIHSLFVLNDFIFYLLTVGASLGIRYFTMLSEIERKQKKLENETLTSELSLLRYQIQPHFFFNSLNNIYSLIGNSPEAAQKSVHNLSKMMRYILYDSSNQTVLLRREIDFLANYVALMRLRMKSDAKVSISCPDDVGEVQIPPLMLIPLLENAFKHGIGPAGEANILCEMKMEDKRLVFSVVNDTYAIENEDKSHSGIGLANLRKRLDILYGDAYVLKAAPSADGRTFEALISIPLK